MAKKKVVKKKNCLLDEWIYQQKRISIFGGVDIDILPKR